MTTVDHKAIAVHVEDAITRKVFPGCVIGVVTRGGKRHVLPFGNQTYASDAPKVTHDTVYDLASVTKSIPTGSLALKLLEEGRIGLDNKLVDYVPEFRNSDRERVLVRHLLTYGLDGYGLASLRAQSAKELFEIAMTRDFVSRPGTLFKYTNLPAMLMGLVIERVSGVTLHELADREFFAPLGMVDTTFFPERLPLERIAPTEIDDWRGLVRGVVHDESAYVCKRDGVIVGHAGLFSTAPDLLTFLEMLLCGGEYNGKRFFAEKTIRHMETNQISHLLDITGLGFELAQPRYMGKYAGEHTFGKTGFTGTLVVVDRKREVAYCILANRTYPKRPEDSSAIHRFRAGIGEIILGD